MVQYATVQCGMGLTLPSPRVPGPALQCWQTLTCPRKNCWCSFQSELWVYVIMMSWEGGNIRTVQYSTYTCVSQLYQLLD